MRTTFIILPVIAVAILSCAFSSVLLSQQTSAQMMNPNMMFNGSGMNPMFAQDKNITGSIQLMPTIFNSVVSQIKVNLSDAILTAQTQAGNNSHVVSAHIDVVNGSVTYTICAIDPDMNIHRLIIDAGNRNVLSSSNFSWKNMMMSSGMMGHNMMGSMMNHKMMGNMMNHKMMGNMMNPNMMGNMMNPNMTGPMQAFP